MSQYPEVKYNKFLEQEPNVKISILAPAKMPQLRLSHSGSISTTLLLRQYIKTFKHMINQ